MSLFFLNLALVITSLFVNIFASAVILKKKTLKPFQVTFINILFLNIFYGIARMPIVLIYLTSQRHGILESKSFNNFRILTALFIIHAICFFVTFLAFQRLIAVTYPMKYSKWIIKRNIFKISIAIYVTIIIGFCIGTVLIVKLSIESVQIDRALCWLFIMESSFIVISYTIVIWKTIKLKFHSSAGKQEHRLVKISVIVSISFLVSYFPLTFYLLLESSSDLFYQIAVLMLWIDNFVNPFVIILDNNRSHCICILKKDNGSKETSVQVTAKSIVNVRGEITLNSIKGIESINDSDA